MSLRAQGRVTQIGKEEEGKGVKGGKEHVCFAEQAAHIKEMYD